MSHQHHESDRAAAYRGLILGAIVLGILLVSIVKLTAGRYAGEAGKAASTGSASVATVALDA